MEDEEVSEPSELDEGVQGETIYDEADQPVWRNLGER